MSNNKQSSIEWLTHELSSLSFDYLVGQITNKEHNERYDKIIKQAKEMHKEEIEDVELRAKEIIIIKHTEHLTPIELPSDEEISEVAMVVYGFDAKNVTDVLKYKAFKRGAKWMRDKIGGNNEPK